MILIIIPLVAINYGSHFGKPDLVKLVTGVESNTIAQKIQEISLSTEENVIQKISLSILNNNLVSSVTATIKLDNPISNNTATEGIEVKAINQLSATIVKNSSFIPTIARAFTPLNYATTNNTNDLLILTLTQFSRFDIVNGKSIMGSIINSLDSLAPKSTVLNHIVATLPETSIPPLATAAADKFPVISVTATPVVKLLIIHPISTPPIAAGSLAYRPVSFNLPLVSRDYYYGKYINGKAGAQELNNLPILKPGSHISLIRNNYLVIGAGRGYIQPPNGYYYGSGLCWSVSAFGGLMDQANIKFQQKYGMPLFIFNPGDRSPHSEFYQTYLPSNNGRGYTVVKLGTGGVDYTFTVNPNIANIAGMSDLQVKIVMSWQTNNPNAYAGEAIGAYLLSNKSF